MKPLVILAFLVVFMAGGADAQVVGIAGVTRCPALYVVMRNGDAFTDAAGHWAPDVNVITSENSQTHTCGATGAIVGIAGGHSLGDGGCSYLYAMTDAGHLLRAANSNPKWACILEGETLFEATGTAGTVEAFGSDSEARLYALTSAGDVFEIEPGFAIVTPRGNIHEGSTPAPSSSWGAVKARYGR